MYQCGLVAVLEYMQFFICCATLLVKIKNFVVTCGKYMKQKTVGGIIKGRLDLASDWWHHCPVCNAPTAAEFNTILN
jgi:hypothetical protein